MELANTFFDDYNPYEKKIFGDWLVSTDVKHLGDVYLNGMSFYEVTSYDKLANPDVKTEVLDNWTDKIVPVHNPKQTKYVWFAEVNLDTTVIYATFQGANPNKELVEINVRRSCFYPKEIGVDYITVRGFEMAHAATPWSPPTGNQPGLIGPHWSKGWIIENNIIHDSKCSAISIGKEGSTGDNYRSIRRDKPGYQYQLESVFSAKRYGWNKEKVGSHTIRNNTIYDCGQNGIVGHLGCVFSNIYHNHIYNIALKREFYGHEIGGIKLHAAIDVQIEVAGFSLVYGGDDRFYNNLFVGAEGLDGVGTSHYENHTTSLEEYIEEVHKSPGDLDAFLKVEQPVYINDNMYLNGAKPFDKEGNNHVDNNFDPKVSIIEDGDEVYLSCNLPEEFESFYGKIHSTDTLLRVRIVDAEFDNPDRSKVILDTDYLDKQKDGKNTLGPISSLKKGQNKIRVW